MLSLKLMKLLRGANSQLKLSCVLSIGTFDGVHRGHQAMLSSLKQAAKRHQLPAVILCFEPHPKEYFSQDSKPYRLMNLREKLDLMSKMDIDYVWCLPFNKKLARLGATDFIDTVVLNKLDVKEIVVGQDFQYGFKRQGNIDILREHGQSRGFIVESFALQTSDSEKISSTAIRRLLSDADFNSATALLGHDYFMIGRVIHGQKRGRQIGVPTANIRIQPTHRPLHGVYAVKVMLPDEKRYQGVANIGFRPTVDGQTFLLEVHLFGFSGDLYDKRLKVTFIEKIRGEQKFESFDELVTQIQADIKEAKERLRHYD